MTLRTRCGAGGKRRPDAVRTGWESHTPLYRKCVEAGPSPVDDYPAAQRAASGSGDNPQRRGISRHDFYDAPPAATAGAIAVTNLPWSEERLDPFIARGLALVDSGHLRGLVLLLRIDHTGAGGRAAILNRAAAIWTCCWRPTWIPARRKMAAGGACGCYGCRA